MWISCEGLDHLIVHIVSLLFAPLCVGNSNIMLGNSNSMLMCVYADNSNIILMFIKMFVVIYLQTRYVAHLLRGDLRCPHYP